MIRTRIVLGSRETPDFVPKDFFDAMQAVTTMYQIDFKLMPTTIRYYIPKHMIVERNFYHIDRYSIELDDATHTPYCNRVQYLRKHTFKRRIPGHTFDRFKWTTEQYYDDYYLLTPNAMYYNIEIFQEWSVSYVLYHNVLWQVHFRQVSVDPHDTSQVIWFHSKPKYQIELICYEDFRGRERELKKAVLAILPRAFRWD